MSKFITSNNTDETDINENLIYNNYLYFLFEKEYLNNSNKDFLSWFDRSHSIEIRLFRNTRKGEIVIYDYYNYSNEHNSEISNNNNGKKEVLRKLLFIGKNISSDYVKLPDSIKIILLILSETMHYNSISYKIGDSNDVLNLSAIINKIMSNTNLNINNNHFMQLSNKEIKLSTVGLLFIENKEKQDSCSLSHFDNDERSDINPIFCVYHPYLDIKLYYSSEDYVLSLIRHNEEEINYEIINIRDPYVDLFTEYNTELLFYQESNGRKLKNINIECFYQLVEENKIQGSSLYGLHTLVSILKEIISSKTAASKFYPNLIIGNNIYHLNNDNNFNNKNNYRHNKEIISNKDSENESYNNISLSNMSLQSLFYQNTNSSLNSIFSKKLENNLINKRMIKPKADEILNTNLIKTVNLPIGKFQAFENRTIKILFNDYSILKINKNFNFPIYLFLNNGNEYIFKNKDEYELFLEKSKLLQNKDKYAFNETDNANINLYRDDYKNNNLNNLTIKNEINSISKNQIFNKQEYKNSQEHIITDKISEYVNYAYEFYRSVFEVNESTDDLNDYNNMKKIIDNEMKRLEHEKFLKFNTPIKLSTNDQEKYLLDNKDLDKECNNEEKMIMKINE